MQLEGEGMADMNQFSSHHALEEVQIKEVDDLVLSSLPVNVVNRTVCRYLNATHLRVDTLEVQHMYVSRPQSVKIQT